MIYFLLILSSSLLEVIAMILIKKYFLNKINFDSRSFKEFFILLFNPFFMLGCAIFLFSVLLFFFTLSKINLLNFFVYFSVSKLVFAFYLSDKFLNEKINSNKIIALVLLFSSIVMISYK